MDPITRRKLHLVKQLYHQAVLRSATSHDVTSRIMSVIGFDLSVETALKVVVDTLDPSSKDERTFPALIKQCDVLLTSAGRTPVPDRRKILHAHDIRNDAQHRAKFPTESAVQDCRTYTRDFLDALGAGVWGMELTKLSLVDAVENEEHRELLAKAEEALALGDYPRAVNSASVGLHRALKDAGQALGGEGLTTIKAVLVHDFFGKPKASKSVAENIQRMRETLLMIVLGLDPEVHARFRILTLTQARMKACGAEEAEFVVAYATETVLQVESRAKGLRGSAFSRL